MANTVYNHVQLGVVDSTGTVNVLYPINTAEDVSIDRKNNSSLPVGVENVQNLADNIAAMAFEDGSNLVYLGTTDNYSGQNPESEINDNVESTASTWSSKKLNSHVERFVPTKDIALNDITALPITKRTFVVNGKNNTYGNLCPQAGYYWFVEYTPVVTSASQVDGFPGGVNTVPYAIQKWTGYAFSSTNEQPVVYTRIYMNNDWGAYVLSS